MAEEIKEIKIPCPECGSTNLRLPDNIEKRDDGVYIKGTDMQLHTLPLVAYVCCDCGRAVTSNEVFAFLENNDADLIMK